MIYFVTNNKELFNHYQVKLYNDITPLFDNEDTYQIYRNWILERYTREDLEDVIAVDFETNGLDAYYNKTVLSTVSDPNDSFVFHCAFSEETKYFKLLLDKEFTLLGQNIKFDLKFFKTKHNLYFRKVYDTMIAEQRLFQKLDTSKGLEALAQKYCDVYPDQMDKSIRNEFIGCNPKTFKVLPRHIYYVAGDGTTLFPIREKQMKLIDRANMNFLIYDIEFPLLSIVVKAELTGFPFDVDKWMAIYDTNLELKHEVELKLDKEFLKLRDEVCHLLEDQLIYIKGGKWDNPRKVSEASKMFNSDGTTNILDLFGEPMKTNTYLGSKAKNPVKIKKNINNINYGSDTQIVEIFGRLKQPLFNSTGKLTIPKFNKNGKINRLKGNYKTGEPELQEYLSTIPGTIMRDFIMLLLEHRALSTACNNFGNKFKDKVNKITGNIHTIFRTCSTATARYSSGDKKQADKYNAQNIPSKASYAVRMRNCFMAKKGHSMITSDLSGAELIIMCSLSQDLKLLEIATDDMHSYIATKAWQLIYRLRGHKLIAYHESLRAIHGKQYTDKRIVDKINQFIKLSIDFIVSKIENKKLRVDIKPVGFGVIYGAYPKKIASVLNISVEEAGLVIKMIEDEFPQVIAMVKQAMVNATRDGYLILNTRTNSRAWFPNLIALKNNEINERTHFGLISKEKSEARNIRIQGTQADMIKECTVELQNWIDSSGHNTFECVYDEISKNYVPIINNDITMLSWVHDEIVTDLPDYLDGRSANWSARRQNYPYSPIIKEVQLKYVNKDSSVNVFNSYKLLKEHIMMNVCNRYLENVQMGVESNIEPYWTK